MMLPVRLCCGQQHLGSMCPDSLVMCCICFDRFPVSELAIDEGDLIDVCVTCFIRDQEQAQHKNP